MTDPPRALWTDLGMPPDVQAFRFTIMRIDTPDLHSTRYTLDCGHGSTDTTAVSDARAAQIAAATGLTVAVMIARWTQAAVTGWPCACSAWAARLSVYAYEQLTADRLPPPPPPPPLPPGTNLAQFAAVKIKQHGAYLSRSYAGRTVAAATACTVTLVADGRVVNSLVAELERGPLDEQISLAEDLLTGGWLAGFGVDVEELRRMA